MQLKQILVPVDFSPHSLNALEYAVELAKSFKARVTVLSIVEPIYYAVPTFAGGAAPSHGTLLEDQLRSGREQLRALERRYAKRRVRLETVVETGAAYEEIVRAAKRRAIDLIVMGTHGRTGLTHLLLGSVAERVVRIAPCPVLTIRGAQPQRPRRPRRKRSRTA